MAFIIVNLPEQKYVCWENQEVKLVEQKEGARKFKEEKVAENFFNSQLSSYFKRDSKILEQFKIVDEELCDSVFSLCKEQKTAQPSAQNSVKKDKLETNKTKTIYNSILPSHFDSDCRFSLSDLFSFLSDIPQSLAPMLSLYGQVDRALEDCLLEIKYRDKEMCDLAHKAEFTVFDAVAMEGYQIFKEIRESRQRRRQAKDTAALLQIIQSTGILDALKEFSDEYVAYCNSLENRQYHPRIRPDLFV